MSRDLLEGLNDPQKQAVLHEQGPLLILAGAGSGKTRVITVKIAWLVETMGYDPESILAVTFTNKAAQEMRERAAALAPAAASVMIRTFHSFGAWFLRRNAALAGLSPHFSIYDDDDVVQLLGTLFPGKQRQQLSAYAHAIARAKDYGQGPEDMYGKSGDHPELPKVYGAYEKRLREIGNVDFGDLILRPLEILKENFAVRQRLQQRYRVILVDEYQDTNMAQCELMRQLCGPDCLMCVVGDDDQSIYRFRGAEVRNILGFPDQYAGTRVIKLERNYRSSQEILSLADAVVGKNENRLGKTMWTDTISGRLPELWLFSEQDMEVEAIVRKIIAEPETDTAILYRTNAQSRIFETALLRNGVMYRIVGTLRFYEREEVKDVLSLLRLLANPRDEVAFRRMVNKPSRGIGDSSVAKILEVMVHGAGDLLRSCSYAIPSLSKKAGQGLLAFVAMLESLQAVLSADRALEHLGMLVDELIKLSGLGSYHKEQDEIGGTQKTQNLEELLNAAALYPATMQGLTEFLEATELDAAMHGEQASDARVTLITMHNTKGLEFDRVIISGMEEGVFPRPDEHGEELEEQRRLLYVALTRARHDLFVTYSRRKKVFGRWADYAPSRFLQELPEGLLLMKDHAGGMGRPVVKAPVARRDEWADYDSAPWSDEESQSNDMTLVTGVRVRHSGYGDGCILQSSMKGGLHSVLVEFDDGRRMKFIPQFTPLHRI